MRFANDEWREVLRAPPRNFPKGLRVDIWHNILWSKYKGAVFSALSTMAKERDVGVAFFQIAETEHGRAALAAVQRDVHKYPYTLLFSGSIDEVPLASLVARLSECAAASDASVIVLAGYHRIEYWCQLLIAKIRGKKVAVFCDSTAFDKPQGWLRGVLKRIFFTAVDQVFCYGERSAEYVHSYGVPYSKISKRCQAAYLPDTYSAERALSMRREARAAVHRAVRFLYVGRLSPEKRVGDAIAALVSFRNLRGIGELRIVGSGDERRSLERLAYDLGVAEHVTFCGPMDANALELEYLSATSLILPSYSEPWGLVVNEALSYGCPAIVSSRCGCVPELVMGRGTGFVFDCGDIGELAIRMCETADAEREDGGLAQRCIAHIDQYSPAVAAGQILAAIIGMSGE